MDTCAGSSGRPERAAPTAERFTPTARSAAAPPLDSGERSRVATLSESSLAPASGGHPRGVPPHATHCAQGWSSGFTLQSTGGRVQHGLGASCALLRAPGEGLTRFNPPPSLSNTDSPAGLLVEGSPGLVAPGGDLDDHGRGKAGLRTPCFLRSHPRDALLESRSPGARGHAVVVV